MPGCVPIQLQPRFHTNNSATARLYAGGKTDTAYDLPRP